MLGAAVNPGDRDVLVVVPYVKRPSTRARQTEEQVLGLAIAGRVDAVGGRRHAMIPLSGITHRPVDPAAAQAMLGIEVGFLRRALG